MKPKILVVDDEPSLRMLMKEYLQSAGYEVNEASSGLEALKMIAGNKPDLIFLDVIMPQMTGLVVLKKIKELFPEIIIVMITALQEESTAREAIELGAYDYVTKPVDFKRIEQDFIKRLFD